MPEPLCWSCTHFKLEEARIAYGRKWVAEHHPELAKRVAEEEWADLDEILPDISACIENAWWDSNPVVCQKIKLGLADKKLYICPHFEKDKAVYGDEIYEADREKCERDVLNKIRKKYCAELEGLSGILPPRRV